jgi:hypothetical protein
VSEPVRSANVLVGLILKTPGLLDQVKADPQNTLEALAAQVTTAWPPPAFVTDVWVYRMVVVSLGVVCGCAVVGTIYLTATWSGTAPVQIPDALTALGSAAVGALAGLLAPSPGRAA